MSDPVEQRPECIILATHMDPSGRAALYSTGFFSTDREESKVRTAFKLAGVPYLKPFASVAVYFAHEDPHDPKHREGFNPPVILKPHVLDRLVIAGTDDIQNIAGWSDPDRIKAALRDLRSLSEKEAALVELLRRRNNETSIEARIFGLLSEEDVAEDRHRNDLLFLDG
jgi:hypothetical protein